MGIRLAAGPWRCRDGATWMSRLPGAFVALIWSTLPDVDKITNGRPKVHSGPQTATFPMAGQMGSLNVAAADAMALYEVARSA